jgi:hypothetical protein
MTSVGQRRRQKIATLEAQANGLSIPLSTQLQDGGIQLEPEFAIGSASGSAVEEYENVVDTTPQSDTSMFSGMNFDQELLDMQLSDDFGE